MSNESVTNQNDAACGQSGSTDGLADALKATGFEICEYGPDEDPCDHCGKTQIQLYGRRCDPFSQDCTVVCADCAMAEHMKNEADELGCRLPCSDDEDSYSITLARVG